MNPYASPDTNTDTNTDILSGSDIQKLEIQRTGHIRAEKYCRIFLFVAYFLVGAFGGYIYGHDAGYNKVMRVLEK
jgi:hypothetical protein